MRTCADCKEEDRKWRPTPLYKCENEYCCNFMSTYEPIVVPKQTKPLVKSVLKKAKKRGEVFEITDFFDTDYLIKRRQYFIKN